MSIAISIVGVAIPTAAVIISVIKMRGKDNNGFMLKKEHDKVCAIIQQNISEKFSTISSDLDEIKSDIRWLINREIDGQNK